MCTDILYYQILLVCGVTYSSRSSVCVRSFRPPPDSNRITLVAAVGFIWIRIPLPHIGKSYFIFLITLVAAVGYWTYTRLKGILDLYTLAIWNRNATKHDDDRRNGRVNYVRCYLSNWNVAGKYRYSNLSINVLEWERSTRRHAYNATWRRSVADSKMWKDRKRLNNLMSSEDHMETTRKR